MNPFPRAVTHCPRCDRRLINPCYLMGSSPLPEDRRLIGLSVCEPCADDLRGHGAAMIQNRCLGNILNAINARMKAPPAPGPQGDSE